jgi:hypothetical protein
MLGVNVHGGIDFALPLKCLLQHALPRVRELAVVSGQDKTLQTVSQREFHENYHIQTMKPHELDYSNGQGRISLQTLATFLG